MQALDGGSCGSGIAVERGGQRSRGYSRCGRERARAGDDSVESGRCREAHVC